MASSEQQQQVSASTLLVILVLSGLFVRYMFFSKPAAQQQPSFQRVSGAGVGGQVAAAARQREQAAERVLAMFPHLDRRTVLWDLQRTGGNLAATIERILAGRVETPPITFQPPPPPSPSPAASVPGQTTKTAATSSQPDLITRYKLQDKIAAAAESEGGSASGATPPPQPAKKAWSNNKEERQSLLQRRRDDMILEARRKMEAKMAAEKAAKAG